MLNALRSFHAMIGAIVTLFALATSGLLAYWLCLSFLKGETVIGQEGAALPASLAIAILLVVWVEGQRWQAHWREHFVLFDEFDKAFSALFWLASVAFGIYVLATTKQDLTGMLILGLIVLATTCDLIFNQPRRFGQASDVTLRSLMAEVKKYSEHPENRRMGVIWFDEKPGEDDYRVTIRRPREE